MAQLYPGSVDPQSMGSLKATIATFTGAVANNDFWASGIPGIITIIPLVATGSGIAMSWTASSGTIFFKPTPAASTLTCLVLSKSF